MESRFFTAIQPTRELLTPPKLRQLRAQRVRTIGQNGEFFVLEEKKACTICLEGIRVEASPNNCSHAFCFTCIRAWSEISNDCPLCKTTFDKLLVERRSTSSSNKYAGRSGEMQRKIVKVKPARQKVNEQPGFDFFQGGGGGLESLTCYQCGSPDDEAILMLCDSEGCHRAFHTYCLTPVLDAVPESNWYCPHCTQRRRREATRSPADCTECSSPSSLCSDSRSRSRSRSRSPQPAQIQTRFQWRMSNVSSKKKKRYVAENEYDFTDGFAVADNYEDNDEDWIEDPTDTEEESERSGGIFRENRRKRKKGTWKEQDDDVERKQGHAKRKKRLRRKESKTSSANNSVSNSISSNLVSQNPMTSSTSSSISSSKNNNFKREYACMAPSARSTKRHAENDVDLNSSKKQKFSKQDSFFDQFKYKA